jgi:hypothetical protein
MRRHYRIAVITALTVIGVLLCLLGHSEPQEKLPNPPLPPNLSLYAGSKSCIECHGKFYQLWSTSRHGLAMQPYSPEFSLANLTQSDEVPGYWQVSLSGGYWPQGQLGLGN